MEIFGFMPMSLVDILDILMVASIIFLLFRWMRGKSAISILVVVLMLLFVRLVVDALGMKLMSAIIGTVIDVGVLALIIIFQPEIRRLFMRIGSESLFTRQGRGFLDRFFNDSNKGMDASQISEIVQACEEMAEEKTGALIVIPHKNSLQYIVETGDVVDAHLSSRLLQNIFFKNSPLHDGAVIVSRGRIVAARCTLPITDRTDIPASYGMRHKAAIGITEESDAVVLVVSEQTGRISYVKGGTLQRIKSKNELKLLLGASMDGAEDNGE